MVLPQRQFRSCKVGIPTSLGPATRARVRMPDNPPSRLTKLRHHGRRGHVVAVNGAHCRVLWNVRARAPLAIPLDGGDWSLH